MQKKNFFFSPFQNEYRKKFAKQKTCHPDAVRGCSGVFHLLDTDICHKHRGPILSAIGLPKSWLPNDQLFSFIGLQFELL